ncbi:STAS/SEC14 domain-containing protein [Maricaulis parjimensis]|uniref:STAS/SEC14 domain-containing protein n=1 Tax=Maricaulis parjimensis TaxID=144023 RepID=UPI001939BC58|nr:STAS/SEC14 domain-containing protein [Maricaulis parjimensis]
MILVDIDAETGLVVAKAVGEVTASDYEQALVPGLEAAIGDHGPVRMLYWFGPEFEGFSPGAVWADARLGLDHMKDIARIAVVTDNAVISAMVAGVGIFMPMPVRVFDEARIGEANRWLLAAD